MYGARVHRAVLAAGDAHSGATVHFANENYDEGNIIAQVRVPVVAGSIADVTFVASRDTSVEEVNGILRKAAGEERWQKVFSITDEPLVSSDIVGSTHASLADLSMTRVVDGNLVKVLAWYDNEMGYVHSLVEHVAAVAKYLS